jgi:hypothetical protein
VGQARDFAYGNIARNFTTCRQNATSPVAKIPPPMVNTSGRDTCTDCSKSPVIRFGIDSFKIAILQNLPYNRRTAVKVSPQIPYTHYLTHLAHSGNSGEDLSIR